MDRVVDERAGSEKSERETKQKLDGRFHLIMNGYWTRHFVVPGGRWAEGTQGRWKMLGLAGISPILKGNRIRLKM